jgi:EmrB/QacA subfamily drug resistance transporter
VTLQSGLPPNAAASAPPARRAEPATGAAPPGTLSARRIPAPRTVLAVASIGVFVAFIDSTIVNIAFPSLEKSFPSAGASGISWVLNAYSLTFAGFLVAGGRLADLLGRRRMFTFSLAVFTLASAVCAAAPTLSILIAARVVQALGAALLLPSSLALVLAAFGAERRSHAVALWSAAGAAAAGVGPSLGGVLVDLANWRLVFLVNLPIGIAGIALAGRHLVESRAPGRRHMPDIKGSTVFALSTALLLLGIVEGRDWGWSSAGVLAAFGTAAALALLFGRRELRRGDPLVDRRLLHIRSLTVANAMTVLTSCGFYGYALANVLFLTGVWRYSILKAGLALTPGPLTAVLVAGISSEIAERLGPRLVLVPGGLAWAGGVLWMIDRVGPQPQFVTRWLAGMVLLGLGAGLVFPNLSAAAVAAAPGGLYATASALNSVARQVGGALGIAVTVTLVEVSSPLHPLAPFHHAWAFAGACLAAAGVGCLGLGRVNTIYEGVPVLPSLTSSARAVLEPAPVAAVPAPAPIARSGSGRAAGAAGVTPPPPESVPDFLAAVPMFEGLSRPLLERLARRCRPRRLAAGEWLFRTGDEADGLFVVRAGRLQIVGDGPGQPVLRELGRGAAVGELALITAERRSASARAVRPTDLIAVDRAAFEEAAAESPELSGRIARVLAHQLRESRGVETPIRPLPATIAVVSLGDAPAPADVGRALAAALSRHARADVLDGRADAEAGSDAGLARLGPLLDRCERANDRTVLVAGDALAGDPWTRFCLQQADRILVLSRGGALPAGLDDHPELQGCDLVACDVRPGSGVLAKLAAALRPIETHTLHADGAEGASLARLARRLNGRSLGLVLSGGGARGFSHIGVLEELLAAGMVIDRVAGVSMGAYIGGLFAAGESPGEIDARCYEEFVRHRPLGDYTLPRRSLIRADRITALLERSFGDLAIEELDRSFFCASTDLRASELVVERHGRLLDAVAASMWLPVIGAPLVRGRQLLVDGSLIDNLPIGTMAALGEGPIVAVDVKASFDGQGPKPKRPPGGDRPPGPDHPAPAAGGHKDSPNKRLRRRLAGGGRATPPLLGETLTRLFLLASSNTSEAASRYADLLIAPKNPGVGLLEWHQIDGAIAAGREAARRALEDAPDHLFP